MSAVADRALVNRAAPRLGLRLRSLAQELRCSSPGALGKGGDSWATGTSEICPKPDRLSDPNRTGGFVIEHRGTTISRLLFSNERPQAPANYCASNQQSKWRQSMKTSAPQAA